MAERPTMAGRQKDCEMAAGGGGGGMCGPARVSRRSSACQWSVTPIIAPLPAYTQPRHHSCPSCLCNCHRHHYFSCQSQSYYLHLILWVPILTHLQKTKSSKCSMKSIPVWVGREWEWGQVCFIWNSPPPSCKKLQQWSTQLTRVIVRTLYNSHNTHWICWHE